MPLYIIWDEYGEQVRTDLLRISPTALVLGDPDSDGRVQVVRHGRPAGFGDSYLNWLINCCPDRTITIRAGLPDDIAFGRPLRLWAGLTSFVLDPTTASARGSIAIAYDFAGCSETGYYVFSPERTKIEMPSYVTLFHELAHAVHLSRGTYAMEEWQTRGLL